MSLTAKQQVQKNLKDTPPGANMSDEQFSQTAGEALANGKTSSKLINRGPDDIGENPNVVAFSKEQCVKARDNVLKCMKAEASAKEKYDLAKGATKTAYNTAAKMGIDDDALKFVLEKSADFDQDFKDRVTLIEDALELPFTFQEPEGRDAVKH